MKKFEFRLEKVLEFRRLGETEAKDLYLKARVETLEAEAQLDGIRFRRQRVIECPATSVMERMTMESSLHWIDEEEQMQERAIAVIRDEESAALTRWQETRKDVKVLERLREEAVIEYQYAANLEEQKALDEWATTSRKVPA